MGEHTESGAGCNISKPAMSFLNFTKMSTKISSTRVHSYGLEPQGVFRGVLRPEAVPDHRDFPAELFPRVVGVARALLTMPDGEHTAVADNAYGGV